MARPRNQIRKSLVSTDRQILAIKPSGRLRDEHRIAKVPGLILRVTNKGVKSWALWVKDVRQDRYRLKTLGQYPALSFAKACAESRRLRSAAESGEDLFVVAKHPSSFAELCQAYLLRHARPKKRSADEDERKIRKDLLPEFGKVSADALVKTDIIAAVDRITDRGAAIAANRTLALVRKIYNWGMAEGLVAANPATGIPMRAPERSRDRVLSDDELAVFWSALDQRGFEHVTADALRLQLLLGARIREVTDLVVDELEIEGPEPVWRLPRERAKSNREIVRPLPPLAVSILRRRIKGQAFVFASPFDPRRPITPRAPARAVKRAAKQGLLPQGFTPHDLRRTAATKLAAMGVEEAVCKRIMGHAPARSDVLASVYNRHSYLPEMRRALEALERNVLELVGCRTNVVQFRERRDA